MFARGIRGLLASSQILLSLRAQEWDTLIPLPGCESLAADGAYLWAFSYDRRSAYQDTHLQGRLYHFRADEVTPFLQDVTPPEVSWHPFGLAYQKPYLWFMNGPRGRPTEVWRYTWSGGKLHSPRAWRHPAFVSLQAIVPLGAEQFYVANDRQGAGRWHLVMGFFVRRVHSNILYCAGDSCWISATGIPYAAGLAYLPALRQLWVSVAFRKALWIYEQGASPEKLYRLRKVRLPGYPDNLYVVSDSSTWVLCHRSLNKWARALAFGGQRSPWSVVEVRFKSNNTYQVRTLYTARRGYATASGVCLIPPYLYVGSVFEPYLLRLRVAEAIPTVLGPANTSAFPAPTHLE
ncbi:MAG: hypothetical protein NZ958_08210 [Bacteroidia bacterium]|nr:hypothetical protein [Bacteroidia bacterium]